MPRIVEVYLVRVATAAHNYAHLNADCEFSQKLFSDRMKFCFYNTKRNKIRRMKIKKKDKPAASSSNATVTGETPNAQ